MNGGLGDDALIGRTGEADEFVFNHGGGDFGNDTISNFELGVDRILIDTFQDDPTDVFFQGAGNDIVMAFAGNAGVITIEDGMDLIPDHLFTQAYLQSLIEFI